MIVPYRPLSDSAWGAVCCCSKAAQKRQSAPFMERGRKARARPVAYAEQAAERGRQHWQRVEMSPEWSPGRENPPKSIPRQFPRLPGTSPVAPKSHVIQNLRVPIEFKLCRVSCGYPLKLCRGYPPSPYGGGMGHPQQPRTSVGSGGGFIFWRIWAAGPDPEARKWQRHARGPILKNWRPFWTHFGPFSPI